MVITTIVNIVIVINAKLVQNTLIICLYLMSLNLSNAQIAKEIGITENDCHAMTSRLREGVYEKRPQEVLEGEVEFDELYLIAGHKGQPSAVKKKA